MFRSIVMPFASLVTVLQGGAGGRRGGGGSAWIFFFFFNKAYIPKFIPITSEIKLITERCNFI